MTRINPIQTEEAEGQVAQQLNAIHSKMGMTPNLIRTMAQSSATLSGYLGLSGALEKASLSRREREQIALAVAEANGCHYCLAAHSAAGKANGLSDLEIRDARRGHATAGREEAILAFTTETVAKRGQVSDDALHRARQAGLTDGEITEIVASVALNLFTNYMNLVAHIDVDFPAAAPLETAQI